MGKWESPLPFGGGAFATAHLHRPVICPRRPRGVAIAFRRGGFRHIVKAMTPVATATKSPLPFGGGAFATLEATLCWAEGGYKCVLRNCGK